MLFLRGEIARSLMMELLSGYNISCFNVKHTDLKKEKLLRIYPYFLKPSTRNSFHTLMRQADEPELM